MVSNYLISGKTPKRMGKRMGKAHINIVPYQVFATKDGHLVLAPGDDGQWVRHCQLAGRPDVAHDGRYVDNAARVERRHELVPVITAWMLERTTEQWIARLEPNGVRCAPILELPEVFKHPQLLSRGMPLSAGGMPMVGTPMRFDGQRPEAELPPPQLDEHGDALRRALALGAGWPAAEHD